MAPEVVVNGESEDLPTGTTLAQLVDRQVGEEADHVAAALNDDVIPGSEWDTINLEAGDEVEIIRPIQGGRRHEFEA